MSFDLIIDEDISKAAKYEQLLPQLAALLEGENDLIANLANVSSLLKSAFDFFWVGFYRVEHEELILGPFQGSLACTRIPIGRGVCGDAASIKQTILVSDVEQYEGHIACSSLSKSEIVVPLVIDGEVKLVLDVDSDALDDFDETDAKYLEKVVSYLLKHY